MVKHLLICETVGAAWLVGSCNNSDKVEFFTPSSDHTDLRPLQMKKRVITYSSVYTSSRHTLGSGYMAFLKKHRRYHLFFVAPLFGRRRVFKWRFCKLYDKYFLKIICRNFKCNVMVRNRIFMKMNQRVLQHASPQKW